MIRCIAYFWGLLVTSSLWWLMSTKVVQIDSDVTRFLMTCFVHVFVSSQVSANEFMPLKWCGKWRDKMKASGLVFYCLSQFSFLNFWQPQFLCMLSFSVFPFDAQLLFTCFPTFQFLLVIWPYEIFSFLTTVIYTNCYKLHVHLNQGSCSGGLDLLYYL